MKLYTTVGALICSSLLVGCRANNNYYTVPAWQGIPASLIAPSSLEAMAWKSRFHARHQGPTPAAPGVAVEASPATMDYGEPELIDPPPVDWNNGG